MTSDFSTKIIKLKNALENVFVKKSDRSHISYGQVNNTSTATVFTATVDGLTTLTDGTTVMLRNGIITSAEGFTLEVNGLGAKPVYNSMADATRDTTIFNINYTMLFVYDSTRVEGGCWICYRGYNSDKDTNTIGYQLRTNSTIFTTTDKGYRYRLWLECADGKVMPVNTSTSTNATAKRNTAMNTRDFYLGGRIFYYSVKADTNANTGLTATSMWQQYLVTLGYSFNNTGSALVLTLNAPVYMVAENRGNGMGRLTSPYYTQTLPNTADNKLYIYLGHAITETQIELALQHPIYEYKNNSIRLYRDYYTTGEVDDLLDGKSNINHTHSGYASSTHNHTKSQITDLSIPSKTSDLTNDSNFISTSNTNGLIKNDGSIDTSSYITSSAITSHNSSSSAHSSLFSGKADSVHTHSTSDITNLPTIPTKTSDLTNDSGFLTSHQDINGKENTSNKVKSTSGWSSTTTDDHYPSEKLVKSSLDNKVDKENGKGLFSGSYGDLSNKPSYTATVTSSTTGAYKMGSINISGSSVDIYGKDTHQSLTDYIQKTSTDTGYLKSNGDIASLPTASTSQSGVVQLSNSTSSSSETLGATAKAVKTVSDNIPTNLEDLTLGTGAVQTDTGIDVISYDNTIDVLYWGLGALSLDLSNDGVYYNDSEIATKGDIPVITGKEDSSNKVSSWSATTNDTRYPSEKLVKDSLDDKISKNQTTGLVKNDGTIMTSGTGSTNWATGNHTHSTSDINQSTSSSFNIHLYERTSYIVDKNNFEIPTSSSMRLDFYDLLNYTGDYVSFKITLTNGSGWVYNPNWTGSPSYYNLSSGNPVIMIEKTDTGYTTTVSVNDSVVLTKTGNIFTGITVENKGSTTLSGYFGSKTYSRKASWLDLIYPIGSIYISTVNRNPSLYFGGTWEQIEDRFLLASGSTYTNGDTGGEATHTLTKDEMPSHTHTANNGNVLGMGTSGSDTTSGFTSGNLWNGTKKKNTALDNTGSGQAHNNMPPYLAVSVWERIT